MDITVRADGTLLWRGRTMRCALGRGGVRADKREGDGATPVMCMPLRRVLYRADRVDEPNTGLPTLAVQPDDGWCDDPRDPFYNRPVRLPHAGSAEALWRDDRLYDVIVVLGHNDDPPIAGKGSAIFLHVAAPGYAPTAGCVALDLADLLAVLAGADGATRLCVTPP